MIFIKHFDQLGRGDIDQAGGKGANLGELTRAGLPVPPGFVVVTAATVRMSRDISWPKRSPCSRRRRTIPPDTTKPRHRFEPSLAMRFRIRSGTRSPMRTPPARTFRLPSAPLRLRRISRRPVSLGSRTPTSMSVDSRIC